MTLHVGQTVRVKRSGEEIPARILKLFKDTAYVRLLIITGGHAKVTVKLKDIIDAVPSPFNPVPVDAPEPGQA